MRITHVGGPTALIELDGWQLLAAAGAVVTSAPEGDRLSGNARGLTPLASTRLEAPGRRPLEITATP